MPTTPKRADQRMGHRTKAEKSRTTKVVAASRTIRAPAADPEWHPLAAEWYASLAKSGERVFYEPSDWATAKFVAEVMSRALNQGQRISSQLVASIHSMQGDLLTTETMRRRSHIELEKLTRADDPSIAIMSRSREAAGQVPQQGP